jgi:hypothetical protein
MNLSDILKEGNNDATLRENIVKEIALEKEEEKKSKKDLTPFDILKKLFSKEQIPEYLILKHYNPWMINRLLFSYKNYDKEHEFIYLADLLNKDLKLDILGHYYFLFKVLPKRDNVYTGYLFNKSDEYQKEVEKQIKVLRWKNPYYNRRGAEQALSVLSQSDMDEIRTEYVRYCKDRGLDPKL